MYRLSTCRFHLQVPNLQMSRRDFAMQQGTGIVVPAMATRARCPVLCRVPDIVVGRHIYLSRLPWIFPGAPLKVNKVPGNIQGNLDSSGWVWVGIWYDKFIPFFQRKQTLVERTSSAVTTVLAFGMSGSATGMMIVVIILMKLLL